MQGSVAWCVLSTHISSIEQQMLQVLNMAVTAGLKIKKKDLWLENLHEKEICFVVILGLRQFQILKNNKKKTLNTDILADISLGSGI